MVIFTNNPYKDLWINTLNVLNYLKLKVLYLKVKYSEITLRNPGCTETAPPSALHSIVMGASSRAAPSLTTSNTKGNMEVVSC